MTVTQLVRARLGSQSVRRGSRRTDDSGYVAILAAIQMPVVLGFAAFAVDVGHWYVTAQQTQRADDASALGGVTYMPGDLPGAREKSTAIATDNGYLGDDPDVRVQTEPVSGHPSELQVTVSQTVDNIFGGLLGIGKTTVTRTAIADYQQPVPMGSPCNEFGNDPDADGPDADGHRSENCSQAGQFWANVGSPKALKSYGDAFQDGNCSDGKSDHCDGSNSDYAEEGYLYQVKVKKSVTNLTFEAFDPAFVSVGDLCTKNLGGAAGASNPYVDNPGQRYAKGQRSPYCTGDMLFGQTGQPPDTTFTVRQPAAGSTPWDPESYPPVGGACTQTFDGFDGDLGDALNAGSGGYNEQVAKEFRRWVPLCTIPGDVEPGTYFIQVQTNADGDNARGDGHNRFALRAYGATGSDDDAISISGFSKMAVYAELPSARTTFYLAQVPPGAGGQILKVQFYDIGDSSKPGTVTIRPPADSGISSFTGCVGEHGPTTGKLQDCSLPADSSYNGKWERVAVPLPKGYHCDISLPTGCWVTLLYDYGSGQPNDTTSWQATLEGNPVRLTR
jgi:hypothetical protein